MIGTKIAGTGDERMGKANPNTTPNHEGDNGTHSYVTDPLHFYRRRIRETACPQEPKSHGLKYLEQLKPKCGDDPRQRGQVGRVAWAYFTLARLTDRMGQVPPESVEHARLTVQSVRWDAQYSKAMRLSGMSAFEPTRAEGKDSATVFTQPRPESDAERQAQQVAPPTQSFA